MEYNVDNMTAKESRQLELSCWKNKIVKHFKGDLYLVLDVVEHSETGENMVLYRALYGNCKSYVRPLSMFAERCTDEQFNKYGQVYKFSQVVISSRKR